MTTLITRLYSDPSGADAAKAALLAAGQQEDTIQIITNHTAGGAGAAMQAARIEPGAAMAYSKAMTGAQALLVVMAPFNPIGTARNAMKTLRKHPAMDLGLHDENVYLREYPAPEFSSSVMESHPLIMSNPFRRLSHGHILGNNPLLPSRVRTSAIRGGAYMSRAFWPMKLISGPRDARSAIHGGMLFSRIFGLPLLTTSWNSRTDFPTIIR